VSSVFLQSFHVVSPLWANNDVVLNANESDLPKVHTYKDTLSFHQPKHAKLLSRKDQLALHAACLYPKSIGFDGCLTSTHFNLPGAYRPYFEGLAPCVNLNTKTFDTDLLGSEYLSRLNPTVALNVLPNAGLCAICQTFDIKGVNLHFIQSAKRFLLEGFDSVAEKRCEKLLMVSTYAPDDPFILYDSANPPSHYAEMSVSMLLSSQPSPWQLSRSLIESLEESESYNNTVLGPCATVIRFFLKALKY
jgi:hypothetical protein